MEIWQLGSKHIIHTTIEYKILIQLMDIKPRTSPLIIIFSGCVFPPIILRYLGKFYEFGIVQIKSHIL